MEQLSTGLMEVETEPVSLPSPPLPFCDTRELELHEKAKVKQTKLNTQQLNFVMNFVQKQMMIFCECTTDENRFIGVRNWQQSGTVAGHNLHQIALILR